MTSFSVVALMKEEIFVIQKFVNYYCKIGARRIYIYIDGEMDNEIAKYKNGIVDNNTEVRFVFCDDVFWEQIDGGRPKDVQPRLEAVFQHCHCRDDSDWLLICDADEFIVSKKSLNQLLDSVPQEVYSFGIDPVEAVWGPDEDISDPFGSSYFRKPNIYNKFLLIRLYGVFFFLFRNGILGHTIGKHFVRKGVEFSSIGCHKAYVNGKGVTTPASSIGYELSDIMVAHFDAISFERWYQKWYRRSYNETISAKKRRSGRRQVQEKIFKILNNFDENQSQWLFRRLFKINRSQLKILESHDAVIKMRLFL